MNPTCTLLSPVYAALLLTSFLLLATASTCSVYAQTDYSSDARVRQETIKGVREAKKIKTDKADVKETHLATDVHTFRAGQPGRRFLSPRDGYEFDEAGYPIIENKPKKKGLFRRKKA
jgi:hypothetical protein